MLNEFIFIFSSLVFVAFFYVLQLCIRGIHIKPAHATRQESELPMVSVLLAARNEEKLIIRSLEAMSKFDYPKDRIEILIGNDQSEDRTAELAQKFIKDKPQFRLFHIHKTMGKGRGKANVLAHLAHEAKGEYFFITDVDVKLPKGWIKGLLKHFSPGVGIVSGTTLCDEGGFFAWMQRIDWMHFMGYIKALANRGVACTSVGNNMAVKAEAYWQTGGYEAIDFSITEDYKLFQELTGRGWDWRNILSPETTGQAWYIDNVYDFLNQRKRWLQGAQGLPWNWKAMILIFGAFIPTCWLLFFIAPGLALLILSLKFMLQSYFILRCFKLAGLDSPGFRRLILYEVYLHFSVILSAFFFIWPMKTRWKGRVYNKEYLGDI